MNYSEWLKLYKEDLEIVYNKHRISFSFEKFCKWVYEFSY